MKKKILISLCIIIAAAALFVTIYQFKKGQDTDIVTSAPDDASHVAVEAKIDGYRSLEEIENKVDIIVKVVKDSEEPPIIQRDNMGNVNFTGTIGNVKVTKIYTDKSDQNIKEGEIIPIFENEAYDSKTNTVYHVAGYTKMEIGKEYMLFLTYSPGDNWYVPCSAVWGKYPLNSSEAALYRSNTKDSEKNDVNGMDTIIEQIGQEVQAKYN